MSEKIRLTNVMKFDIGIALPEKPLGINIRPGAFAMVTADDKDYLISTCDLIQKGYLQVDNEHKEEVLEEVGIDAKENAAFMTDEEITEKLKGTVRNMQTWINGVDDPIILDRIGKIAKEMELSVSKAKILHAKIPGLNLTEE